MKGLYYTNRYCQGDGRIVFQKPFLKLRISKHKEGRFVLNGNLILTSHCNGRGYVSIVVSRMALLKVNHDFGLGQNNKIYLNENSTLILGGKDKESLSGITCDSMIMCYRYIELGVDLICSWDVYISDSDWHTMVRNGERIKHHDDVIIGNHVWIGSNVIIGKGTKVGNNCIVGAYTKISQTNIEDNCTIVGIPSKIISHEIEWEREIS